MLVPISFVMKRMHSLGAGFVCYETEKCVCCDSVCYETVYCLCLVTVLFIKQRNTCVGDYPYYETKQYVCWCLWDFHVMLIVLNG